MERVILKEKVRCGSSVGEFSMKYVFGLPDHNGRRFDDLTVWIDSRNYKAESLAGMEAEAMCKAQKIYEVMLRDANAALNSVRYKQDGRDVKATLKSRGKIHGDYEAQSGITNKIKSIMRNANRWGALRPAQQEALDMIASKMSRILEGDPNHSDHWHDIAGYATLVERSLPDTDPTQTELDV